MTDDEAKKVLGDFDAFWLTLWAEARNEPIEGLIAVACVIRNRVQLPGRFGKTYAAVCLAPKQFSCWIPDGGLANYRAVMALAHVTLGDYAERTLLPFDPIVRQVRVVAENVINGALLDRSHNATHYYAPAAMVPREAKPSWALDKQGREIPPVAEIGAQRFYKVA